MISTKTCTKCKKEYPATNEHFHKHPAGKYGLQPICKTCKHIEENKRNTSNKDKLISKFIYLLRLKLYADSKTCSQCKKLLPRTEEYFCNPDSKGQRICKKCALENRTGTKREGFKVCKKCGEELPATLEYFDKDEKCHYGVKAVCKRCRDIQRKKWAKDNKEHIKEIREKNKELHKATREKYLSNNKDVIKLRKAKYRKIKREHDPKFRLNHSISRSINDCLSGRKNGKRWVDLVGYTKYELFKHLENQFKPGMTWENYGVFGWHVDHIRPIASFNFINPEDEEFKQCWALENLQPLWWQDNIAKSDKWESA